MKEKHEIILCECSSLEHQLVTFYDQDDNTLYMNVHLVKYGALRRFYAAMKYLFGYKCRYGAWDEVIIGPEQAKQLITELQKVK